MKNVLAAIVGYISMFVAVFLCLTAAYFAFGTERAFQPGSYKTSFSWCMVSLVLGIPAALLGGRVCAKIAKNPKATLALALAVLRVLFPNPGLTPAVRPGSHASSIVL